MKKSAFLIAVIIAAMLIGGVLLFSSDGASGTNIKVQSASDSQVFFKPVCPECDHIGELYSVNLSDGESHSTVHVCETCYEVYDISIER